MLKVDLLSLAQGIAAELYDARASGKLPVAILVDAPTCARLQAGRLGSSWRSGQPELFNLPLVIDAEAKGWTVRVR